MNNGTCTVCSAPGATRGETSPPPTIAPDDDPHPVNPASTAKTTEAAGIIGGGGGIAVAGYLHSVPIMVIGVEHMADRVTTACAIIRNGRDEVLLTRRAREPFKGCWALPSGVGESLRGVEPAVGVVEEVRCDLGTTSFRGRHAFTMPVEADPVTDAVAVFSGSVDESDLRPDPVYSAGYRWFARDDVPDSEALAFQHGEILRRFFATLSVHW